MSQNTHVNKVLIDADSLVYIQAWDVRKLPSLPENYPIVLNKIDQFVVNILNATRAERYIGFLKGSQPTFRHIANPEYKANRKGSNEWLDSWGAVIKHRLVTHWKFIQVEGMEAEDAIGMMMCDARNKNAIIAHIDKDVDQIPGVHYNYKKLNLYQVTELEAERNLFVQVITGDTTDNIPGIPGIGPVTAKKILAPGLGSYYQLALETYIQNYGERNGIISFYENYLMCKLLDRPSMGFNPNDIPWTDFVVPEDSFIPSPEEFLESWTEPEPDTEESFNPTNNHESSEQLI